MKVSELIEKLSKYNPDLELEFSCGVESGRSYDVYNNGSIQIVEDETLMFFVTCEFDEDDTEQY